MFHPTNLLLSKTYLIVSSRQIRPPIYSIKQTKLRKRRVIRYSVLYFALFVVFIGLIAGPLVAGKNVKLPDIPLDLAQPTGFNNNDTLPSETGTKLSSPKTASSGGDGGGGGGGGGGGDGGGDTGGGGDTATDLPPITLKLF